jgi:hypothetical protein
MIALDRNGAIGRKIRNMIEKFFPNPKTLSSKEAVCFLGVALFVIFLMICGALFLMALVYAFWTT